MRVLTATIVAARLTYRATHPRWQTRLLSWVIAALLRSSTGLKALRAAQPLGKVETGLPAIAASNAAIFWATGAPDVVAAIHTAAACGVASRRARGYASRIAGGVGARDRDSPARCASGVDTHVAAGGGGDAVIGAIVARA